MEIFKRIKIMKIQDYGFLFNNYSNSKNIFSNMLNTISKSLSDHSSIKSGNYNKLVSAYFDKTKDTDNKKKYTTYNSMGELIKASEETLA